MPHARLEVAVQAAVVTADGAAAMMMLLVAHPPETRRPRARGAAAGGESPVMLALRLVLTEGPSSRVFDEVDVGIGGEAGSAVGRLLADLARRHQVLCVTHLAQVAAHAHSQVAVEKLEADGRTVARAVVDGDVGWGSCPGCWPGSASPTTCGATPWSCSNGPPRHGPSRPDRGATLPPVTGSDTPPW